jgi:hypothetical protein
MNKKLIGLISVFIFAEIVCIIGYNVQVYFQPTYLCRELNINSSCYKAAFAANEAYNEKIRSWSTAIFIIGFIFIILLTILISFNYYQKRKKRNTGLPIFIIGFIFIFIIGFIFIILLTILIAYLPLSF